MLYLEYIYENEYGHLIWRDDYDIGYLGAMSLTELYNVIQLTVPINQEYELTFTKATLTKNIPVLA